MASYAKAIGDAIVGVVSLMASPPAQTVFRKFDSVLLPDKANAAAVCCVVTVLNNTSIAAEFMGSGGSDLGGVIRGYNAQVAIYKLHAGQVQLNSDIMLSMALAIQQALDRPTLLNAPTVTNATLTPFVDFSPANFRDGYECMKMNIVFDSAEGRNG